MTPTSLLVCVEEKLILRAKVTRAESFGGFNVVLAIKVLVGGAIWLGEDSSSTGSTYTCMWALDVIQVVFTLCVD